VHPFFGGLSRSVLLGSSGVLRARTPAANTGPVARPSALAQKLKYAGLPRFGKVNDSLYRGAQPYAEGFQQLKSLGITIIIDLREQEPGKIAWECKQSEALGIRFLHLPVSGWSTPREQQLAGFFSIFRSSPHEKVFVHCQFGEDRTGVFVAAYRVAFDHWSAEQAVDEMLAYGFHRWWHPAMVSYVRSLPDRLQADPLLKSALRPRSTTPVELAR
jgi:tyrosine-protein phosphatase SIW14